MERDFLVWLQVQFSAFKDKAWMVEVFIVVLLTAILSYLVLLCYRRIHPKLENNGNIWDNAIIRAIYKPLSLLIWLFGLVFAAEIVVIYGKHANILSAIHPMRNLGLIFLFAWFVVRLVNEVEINLLKPHPGKSPPDKTTVYAIGKLVRTSIIVTTVLIGLQTFGINISALLAFGGIGGAVVAFSAKDLLANFFGGIIIYLDRPFSVGDWVRSPDKNIEGVVEHIGWRLTRIRTFDKRPLYVPNAVFTTISVENPSRMTNRRIKTYVGVRYADADKVADIVNEIRQMLEDNDEIDQTCTTIVNFTEFAPSSLNIMIYTFTKTTNWIKYKQVEQEVYLKIIDIIHQNGAQCAFPTTTLHVADELAIHQSIGLPQSQEKHLSSSVS